MEQIVTELTSVNVFKNRLEDMGIYSWETTSPINYNYKYIYSMDITKRLRNRDLQIDIYLLSLFHTQSRVQTHSRLQGRKALPYLVVVFKHFQL